MTGPLPFPVYDEAHDKPRDECGVFGVFGAQKASALTALGLHALQHRGQEGCGIAAYDAQERRFSCERHLGLVDERFSRSDPSERLPGASAIGHVLYSTQGASGDRRNLQPLYADLHNAGMAITHNGNLTNARTLREEMVANGKIFQSTSDTEVVLHLFASSRHEAEVSRLIEALSHVEGAYALIALTGTQMIGARDPLGIRPLVLGDLGGAPILASETCALDMIGADFIRDVEPGEIIVCNADGVHEIKPETRRTARTCAFEYIYFARPDSVIDGVSVYEARKHMGRLLAQEHSVDADVVVPVPDSGMAAANGFAQASGLPFELGIIRSHFVGRTFISPTQEFRDLGVRMKHRANASALDGKRVVLVDDSIVRGTTSRKIVQMVRDAGATEVHFRSASPPIKWGDFYGIDMPLRETLLAARLKDVEAMRDELKVDSLGFLSVDNLYRAILGQPRDAAAPQLCDHYFTDCYPTGLTDVERGVADKGRQLSLLESS